jgi:hypothetical protein
VNLEELARDAMRIFEVQTNETGVDARVTTTAACRR